MRLGEDGTCPGHTGRSVFEPRPFLLYCGAFKREVQPGSTPPTSKKGLGMDGGGNKMPRSAPVLVQMTFGAGKVFRFLKGKPRHLSSIRDNLG